MVWSVSQSQHMLAILLTAVNSYMCGSLLHQWYPTVDEGFYCLYYVYTSFNLCGQIFPAYTRYLRYYLLQ